MSNLTINDQTYAVDIWMNNFKGNGVAYLLKSEKTCLIDGGTQEGSLKMIKRMKFLDAFPPDLIIITHSHFDHTQAIPIIRKQARKEGKEIKILASQKALPQLQDQSFNKIFYPEMEFTNILNVISLQEGAKIDLGDITIRIIEVPGHIKDHIAVFDETHKILFVGDSLGVQFIPEAPYPNFMPPSWNKEDYFRSMEKMETIAFQGIALAHYGHLDGKEARNYIKNLHTETEKWLSILGNAEEEDSLNNIPQLYETIFQETVLKDYKGIFDKDLFYEYIRWTLEGYMRYKGL